MSGVPCRSVSAGAQFLAPGPDPSFLLVQTLEAVVMARAPGFLPPEWESGVELLTSGSGVALCWLL